MAKPEPHIVSEEEMDRIEQESHHEELIETLSKLVPPSTDLSKIEAALDALVSKESPVDEQPELMRQLLVKMDELKKAVENRPKSFKVHRNTLGFIDKVVAE